MQVQRICLAAAVQPIRGAILACSKHEPHEYISDVDLMTVYLEQVGIANEVPQFFGLHKFRLGRILWSRHRATLPTLGDVHQPGFNQQAPKPQTATRDVTTVAPKPGDKVSPGDGDGDVEMAGTSAQHAELFVVWMGNGLFWLVPYALQWILSALIGSGLIDNGRLDPQHFE